MAESMKERVARALHKAHMPWCDYTYPFEHRLSSREVYEALAEAAIAAMREPTEGMCATLDVMYPTHDDPVPSGEDYWRAGIDAALRDA